MLLDLTPFVNRDKTDMSMINAASEQPYKWDGKMWALAIVNDTRYTIYNKTLFRAAGLADLPQVWDDASFTMDAFLTYCQKLTNPSRQEWGYVFEGNGIGRPDHVAVRRRLLGQPGQADQGRHGQPAGDRRPAVRAGHGLPLQGGAVDLPRTWAARTRCSRRARSR